MFNLNDKKNKTLLLSTAALNITSVRFLHIVSLMSDLGERVGCQSHAQERCQKLIKVESPSYTKGLCKVHPLTDQG